MDHRIVKKYFISVLLLFLLWNCSERGLREEEWVLGPFEKLDEVNPVLEPVNNTWFLCPLRGDSVQWEVKDVFNPAAVVKDGKIFLLYRAEDSVGRYAGTSRIGLAVSDDGLHFKRNDQPVLFPSHDGWDQYEWEGGVEDPRVVEDETGNYWMTYTTYDGDKARLCVATSSDLVHWTKYGSVFEKAKNQNWKNEWSKSGAIITQMRGDKQVAVRVKDKYWMYFGDTHLYLASSENFIDWTPVVDSQGKWKQVLSPRVGKFDSELVEPGPPALLTEKGILLIYNSRNDAEHGDPQLERGSYAAGQVMFSLEDPSKEILRKENNFFKPDKPYEITGQVNNVCFLEGMVFFQDRWLIYYGTADSKIAVAESLP